MRTSLVVVDQEPMRRFAHLIEIIEQIQIEHRVTEGAVVALDEGVLIGFARLDVANLDRAVGAPGHKALREKLWPVVTADGAGSSPAPGTEVLKHSDDSLGSDQGIDLDREPLAREVIDDIEGAKRAPRIKAIAHEVDRPNMLRTRGHLDRHAYARGQALAIGPEALARVLGYQGVQRLNDRGVIARMHTVVLTARRERELDRPDVSPWCAPWPSTRRPPAWKI